MDNKMHAVREVLSRETPEKATAYIQSFGLPEEEECCLIDREVKQKSVQQISRERSMSPETVKRRRRNALSKIVNGLGI